MIIKSRRFQNGYNQIIKKNRNKSKISLDFGMIILEQGNSYQGSVKEEELFILLRGNLELLIEGKKYNFERNNLFTENPYAIHSGFQNQVRITAVSENCEIALVRNENRNQTGFKVITPENIKEDSIHVSQAKGSTQRTIRTIIDFQNAPLSSFCCGEVIGRAGHWSSYPPHYHSQSEIYHYRFSRENGFGFSGEGENVYVVKNGDTAAIRPMVTHPQAAAPGYEMYYLWVIPNLKNDPFTNESRKYSDEHQWLNG